jgi:hypothetical protein
MACCVIFAALAAGLVSLVAWLTGRQPPDPASWSLPPAGEEAVPPKERP